MKKKLLFFLILFISFFTISKVSAATAIPYGMSSSSSISSFKEGITLLPLKLYNDSFPNWNTSQYLQVYARPSETYNYIALEVCSYYDITYYVDNNNFTSANFFNNNSMPYTPVNIGSCSITGVSGTYKKWRIYIQVANWGIPSGGADVYYTRGTILFRNLGEHSQYVEIQNAYLTDSNEDMSMAETNEKLDNINDTQKETNEKLDETNQNLTDINDSINNDDVDSENTTDTLDNLSSEVASNNVISDLLLLPVSLFQKILNSINGSCSSFNLGSLYNSDLSFPCIDLKSLLGTAIYNSIDIIISGIFILSIRKKFVNIFESLSSLKDGRNDLE